MAQAIAQIWKQAETQMSAYLESFVAELETSKSKNDDLLFQVSALQEHILRLESKHDDTKNFNDVSLSNLANDNKTLKMQVEKLEQDNQIMQRSIYRREMMRAGQSPLKTTEPPLKERQSNLSLSPDAATNCKNEHELKSLRAKYATLKHYNQNLATKYRKERAVWKQWVDHIGTHDHGQLIPRACNQIQTTDIGSPITIPGTSDLAPDSRSSDSNNVVLNIGNAQAPRLCNRSSKSGSPITMKSIDSSPTLSSVTGPQEDLGRDDVNKEIVKHCEMPERLQILHNEATMSELSSRPGKPLEQEQEISILITSDSVTEESQEKEQRGSIISVKDEIYQNKMKDEINLSQHSVLSDKSNLDAHFNKPRESTGPLILPYCEVVRGKAARKALHATDCPCCSRFYELAGPGVSTNVPVWKAEMATAQTAIHSTTTRQQVGRHRARFHRSPTPPNFWNCEFPTTQQLDQEREWNKKRRTRKEIEADDMQESDRYKLAKR